MRILDFIAKAAAIIFMVVTSPFWIPYIFKKYTLPALRKKTDKKREDTVPVHFPDGSTYWIGPLSRGEFEEMLKNSGMVITKFEEIDVSYDPLWSRLEYIEFRTYKEFKKFKYMPPVMEEDIQDAMKDIDTLCHQLQQEG